MSWNHRIVRKHNVAGTESGEWLMICEVYYNKDGSVAAHTVDAVGVCGESLKDLKQSLKWMQKAITQPILDSDIDFRGFDDALEWEADESGETSKTED